MMGRRKAGRGVVIYVILAFEISYGYSTNFTKNHLLSNGFERKSHVHDLYRFALKIPRLNGFVCLNGTWKPFVLRSKLK